MCGIEVEDMGIDSMVGIEDKGIDDIDVEVDLKVEGEIGLFMQATSREDVNLTRMDAKREFGISTMTFVSNLSSLEGLGVFVDGVGGYPRIFNESKIVAGRTKFDSVHPIVEVYPSVAVKQSNVRFFQRCNAGEKSIVFNIDSSRLNPLVSESKISIGYEYTSVCRALQYRIGICEIDGAVRCCGDSCVATIPFAQKGDIYILGLDELTKLWGVVDVCGPERMFKLCLAQAQYCCVSTGNQMLYSRTEYGFRFSTQCLDLFRYVKDSDSHREVICCKLFSTPLLEQVGGCASPFDQQLVSRIGNLFVDLSNFSLFENVNELMSKDQFMNLKHHFSDVGSKLELISDLATPVISSVFETEKKRKNVLNSGSLQAITNRAGMGFDYLSTLTGFSSNLIFDSVVAPPSIICVDETLRDINCYLSLRMTNICSDTGNPFMEICESGLNGCTKKPLRFLNFYSLRIDWTSHVLIKFRCVEFTVLGLSSFLLSCGSECVVLLDIICGRKRISGDRRVDAYEAVWKAGFLVKSCVQFLGACNHYLIECESPLKFRQYTLNVNVRV